VRIGLFIAAAGLGLSACHGSSADALILRITSPLTIPRETNQLVATVTPQGGASAIDSYDLGAPPRDGWPQTLPIVAGDHSGRMLDLQIELRNSSPNRASVAVGFAEMSASIPASGEETRDVVVPRNCTDMDGDGYGVGFGCIGPDCNDMDPTIPAMRPCPGMGDTDGGVGDGGSSDGGLLGGFGKCLPGANPCSPDQACFMGVCFQKCSDSVPCADLSYGCLPGLDVCLCKAPCGILCNASACVNGCCG
jgi:hypothetical protein